MNHNALRRHFTILFLLVSLIGVAQIPNGYYNQANDKTGDALKVALHDIIKGHTTVSYSNLWDAFWSTDNKGDGVVWDMYSDVPGGTPPYTYQLGEGQCGEYNSEGDCYNREHSWPKSWFGSQTTPECDLHHIFPTDGFVNAQRSNFPFGEVQSASWTSRNGSKLGTCKSSLGYSGTVFEPIDAYKGDFARALMYMSVRYYGEDNNWGSSGMTNKSELLPWAIAMLMEWNEQDPVSQKEIDRNNAIYTDYQHNRNPFVDHPEYARMIWDSDAEPPVTPDPSATDGDYVKVTSAPSDWSGEYLIVYEGGNVAFNGALETLDAVGNTIAVTITEGTIASSTEVDAATFTIAAINNGYSIKSASGYYIGQTSDANGLKSDQTTVYANSLAYNDGDIDIISSGGAYLRYNAASDQARFRYYKSSTYTNQKAIQLYKKTVTTATQSVTLAEGWNWWAPTVEADDLLDQLEETLGDHLLQIVGRDGVPSAIVAGQMYKILTDEAITFALSGTAVAAEGVTLAAGTTWFGCSTAMAVSLSDLVVTPAQGDKIVSQDEGFAVFNGTAWVGTLTTLQPGRGYVYWSADTATKTLTYP